ncbi:enhancer of mRNA decapping [Taxawa tesnikishii (nom. ined.)]|nr:enhancer of mRNA decapping [Dothideales sp. JES 119]
MSASFVGMTLSVTLLNPPNAVVNGRVAGVVAGQTLVLEDAWVPTTNERLGQFNVPSNQIADLKVIQGRPPQAPPPVPAPIVPLQVAAASPSATKHASFADPAIVGYSRAPRSAARATVQQDSASMPIKSVLSAASAKLPTGTSPFVGNAPQTGTEAQDANKTSRYTEHIGKRRQSQETVRAANENTSATSSILPGNSRWPQPVRDYVSRALTEELPADVSLEAVARKLKAMVGEAAEQNTLESTDWANLPPPQEQLRWTTSKADAEPQSGKKTRRGKKGPAASAVPLRPVAPKQTISPDVSRNGNDMNSTVKSKKGWRSTPLLQEQLPSPVNGSEPAKKKRNRRSQAQLSEMQNGWATEDATDIQGLDDFDFEANLSKFDKRTVFDQIRNEDTTADEERLVSHNRLPKARPGTYGGKNLHPTENVLSPKLGAKHGSSGLESASDADTELNFGSGRNSRESMSRASTKRPPRRSDSGMLDDGHHVMTASFTSNNFNRSMSSIRNAAMHGSPGAASSLTLFVHGHPIEADVTSSFRISEDAITENAARGVAQTILSVASKPGANRRNSKPNAPNLSISGGRPVVVILAGNHTTGARAIAAARHLYGRGLKILVCVPEYASPSVWHPQLARQLQSLQACGRKAARIEGWTSTSAYIKRLEGPPVVIVDALLDGVRYEDVHDRTRQAEVREMIEWANRSRAGVVSIGCPSGFHASDGSTTVLEGEPLAVQPEKVIALGAPLQGLLEAVRYGDGSQWAISVADIGINMAFRSSETVQFGSEWLVGLKFSPGEDGDGA